MTVLVGTGLVQWVSTPDRRLLTARQSRSATTRPLQCRVMRIIRSAELLSIGTEITSGETQDTNAGELARQLTELGVEVHGLVALPDDLQAATAAFRSALEHADLVVSTGGLGPTPDDLTREAIAAACGETPAVDRELEAWLSELFERRGLAMAEMNRKQAWLIPSAAPLANPNGTAPGWFVERPDGRVIVALPGPPREMRPMWRDAVMPRLQERRIGGDRWARTLRLTGIGESAAAELIGEDLLRGANPSVATYARAASVDVRVAATSPGDGRSPRDVGEPVTLDLEKRLAAHVFAHDDETWIDAIGRRLAGRSLAIVEMGTGGSLTALLGDAPWLVFAELLGPASPLLAAHRSPEPFARNVRDAAPADVGLAVMARERRGDTAVTVAVAIGAEVAKETRTAFLGGAEGRRRAALVAAGVLWKRLGESAARAPRGGAG
jgi:competence/damage-inducible protein CinA-like protein